MEEKVSEVVNKKALIWWSRLETNEEKLKVFYGKELEKKEKDNEQLRKEIEVHSRLAYSERWFPVLHRTTEGLLKKDKEEGHNRSGFLLSTTV